MHCFYNVNNEYHEDKVWIKFKLKHNIQGEKIVDHRDCTAMFTIKGCIEYIKAVKMMLLLIDLMYEWTNHNVPSSSSWESTIIFFLSAIRTDIFIGLFYY